MERSPVRAYLQLLRIPNVFTAIADICMGFLFVSSALVPLGGFLLTLIASVCLYLSGMVFNDVFDIEVDRQERPHRPIPSGQISLGNAKRIAVALMASGILLAAVAGIGFSAEGVNRFRPLGVSLLLATAIVLYDAILKRSILVAPLAMGSCRMLNVLMGMSLFGPVGDGALLTFSSAQWLVAGGIGVYIAGVTWFARTESTTSRRGLLSFGLAVMVAGVVVLAMFPRYGVDVDFSNDMVWPMLLLLIMFSVFRRAMVAIANPTAGNVQAAVKLSIFSLIVLDAAICLAVRGPVYGVGVLALLIPTWVIGSWIYST